MIFAALVNLQNIILACHFTKKKTLAQVFSSEFCKIFKTNFGLAVRQLRYFVLRCKRGGGVFIVKIRYVTHEKNFLQLLLYFINYQQQNLSSLKIYKFIN